VTHSELEAVPRGARLEFKLETGDASWSGPVVLRAALNGTAVQVENVLHRRRPGGVVEFMDAASRRVVLRVDTSEAALEETRLRLVGGELQVRGPRAEEVRRALETREEGVFGAYLDDLLTHMRTPDDRDTLGGWLPCRQIASS